MERKLAQRKAANCGTGVPFLGEKCWLATSGQINSISPLPWLLELPHLSVAGTFLEISNILSHQHCTQSAGTAYWRGVSLFDKRVLEHSKPLIFTLTIMASTDSKEVDLSVEMAALDAEQGDKPGLTDAPVPVASMGTAYDQRDMRVMGKLQELRVSYIHSRIRSAQELTIR